MASPSLGVVIPAAADEGLADTLASVWRFGPLDVHVVVVDDSAGTLDVAGLPATTTGRLTVLPAPADAPGRSGGLWVKVGAGLRCLADSGLPRAVLRMDVDSLMIREGIERTATDAMEAAPDVGVFGAVRIDCFGRRRDWRPARSLLEADTGLRALAHPRLARRLRIRVARAVAHGYVPGEHALGGAYLLRPELVQRLADDGELEERCYRSSRLGEDHLCGLLARASGFGLADLSGPGQPMAIKWRGLPADPVELQAGPAQVVHSVRSYGAMREPAIRRYFAVQRDA